MTSARHFFGTDGIRGRVGVFPITPEFVLKLGYTVGRTMRDLSNRPQVLIGKDTRVSGYLMESSLEAGLSAAGVDVVLVGPMPTPAVAYLVKALRLDGGIVISASHNPYEDNGIKFFGPGGVKWPDDWESRIEKEMDSPLETVAPEALGKVRRLNDALTRYLEFCRSGVDSEISFKGLKLAVDTANGACYQVLPDLLRELGAQVSVTANTPDGFNINRNCGATHPDHIAGFTHAVGADLGIAVDGDGDRLIMCDATGRVFDGDDLLYAIIKDRLHREEWSGGVVGTLMTNYALEKLLQEKGVPFERAKVGDRYVLEKMQSLGWRLGGENSGHIICLDRHTTGDASIAVLEILSALQRHHVSLTEWVSELRRTPQVLINVPVSPGLDPLKSSQVKDEVLRIEKRLQGHGRVLLRPSGTEPIVRVMVESEDRAEALILAQALARTITEALAH